jgi:uncharacterized membrane protein
MSDSRTRIWFALFVLVVFCLGGAGGFIAGRHMPPRPFFAGGAEDGRGFGRGGPGRRGGPPAFGRGGPAGPAGMPPEAAERLADQLQLDAAQREQFRKVLDEHRTKFEQVHREARERFDSEQQELRQGIRALLRPDQVQRFDRLFDAR